MGLFDRVFRPEKAKESERALREAQGYFAALTAYRPAFTSWDGAIYEHDLVRSAIDARARHISKLKVELVGSAKPKLQTKLRTGPNQWQTWSQFLYRTSTILDATNTCIIVPVFDDDMIITGYIPVLPQKTEVIDYLGEPWLKFHFAHRRTGAVKMSDAAILTKFQYEDDFFGSSNKALDETMKLIHIQNQGIEEAIKTSATYRFMAQVSNFSTTEDLAKERGRFTQKNLSADAEETGGILLFPNTYTNIKQIDQKAYTVDAQQRANINENVDRYFGVNAKVMSNSANADELDAFFNGAIEPFSIQFAEAMTKAIYSEQERNRGNALIATANRLQYMSVSARVSMAQQLGDRGAIMIDEIRELFNYPPLPNGEGHRAPIRGEYYMVGEEKTTNE